MVSTRLLGGERALLLSFVGEDKQSLPVHLSLTEKSPLSSAVLELRGRLLGDAARHLIPVRAENSDEPTCTRLLEDMMAHRADVDTFTPAQRAQVVTLMLGYLTDDVVADHATLIHAGLELFTGHRAYILGMEHYLTANGGGAFVPLPFWNSANPIPLTSISSKIRPFATSVGESAS